MRVWGYSELFKYTYTLFRWRENISPPRESWISGHGPMYHGPMYRDPMYRDPMLCVPWWATWVLDIGVSLCNIRPWPYKYVSWPCVMYISWSCGLWPCSSRPCGLWSAGNWLCRIQERVQHRPQYGGLRTPTGPSTVAWVSWSWVSCPTRGPWPVNTNQEGTSLCHQPEQQITRQALYTSHELYLSK